MLQFQGKGIFSSHEKKQQIQPRTGQLCLHPLQLNKNQLTSPSPTAGWCHLWQAVGSHTDGSEPPAAASSRSEVSLLGLGFFYFKYNSSHIFKNFQN